MAESKIEWCTRSDWNPIRGCTRVSPGCGGPGPHGGCYAEAIAGRFSDPGQAFHGFAKRTPAGGGWTGRVELVEDRITLPMRWRKPALIFASSTSDFFHEKLSFDDIDRLFAVMALSPQHTFQILTKRSDRMRAYMARLDDFALEDTEEFREAAYRVDCDDDDNGSPAWHAQTARLEDAIATVKDTLGEGRPLPNVWLGVSVEDQHRADERREDLRNTPAVVRFVSYEPALGAVDWRGWEFIDWIISGGESGRQARPSHPDWHRAARDFCAAHGIAYMLKQWGEHAPYLDRDIDDPDWRAPYSDFERSKSFSFLNLAGGCGFHGDRLHVMQRVGKKAAGRLLDGVTHDGFPTTLAGGSGRG